MERTALIKYELGGLGTIWMWEAEDQGKAKGRSDFLSLVLLVWNIVYA